MMIRCQSVRSLAFLQAEWIPMLTDISISRPQPAGTRPSTRSPPMTGRSEWRPSDPMVILFRVPTCHMHKQAYSGAVVEIAQDWVRNITDALICTHQAENSIIIGTLTWCWLCLSQISPCCWLWASIKYSSATVCRLRQKACPSSVSLLFEFAAALSQLSR